MSVRYNYNEEKKQKIKEIIKKLHSGTKPDEVKEEFKAILKGVEAVEISKIEEELIKEGMPKEEILRLCDVHLTIFRESLEKAKSSVPEGHPIHTLMEEHKILLQFNDKLKNLIDKIKQADAVDFISKEMNELNHIVKHLKESESHYIREENVLFPYLEKHNVTQPPAIMWSEHDQIRAIKKNLFEVVLQYKSMDIHNYARKLEEVVISLRDLLQNHFYKENNILFPTALNVITEDEWSEIREQFDELGYCCFTPEYAKKSYEKSESNKSENIEKAKIAFESGFFNNEELETLLNTLPIDITFVDKDDRVRYFSQSKERIFTRTKAVIGRTVQLCHPQKSLHKVEEILSDFKNNKRNAAFFWINLNGRMIYIQYFAVRSKSEEYLGCLEVTQDITDIKKIEGEKRLL